MPDVESPSTSGIFVFNAQFREGGSSAPPLDAMNQCAFGAKFNIVRRSGRSTWRGLRGAPAPSRTFSFVKKSVSARAPKHARAGACAPRIAFRDLPSTIFHLQFFGGIAQLVERQLCKLEVRGSNPLASSLRSQRSGERRLSRRRSPRRPKADLFTLPHQRSELRRGMPFSHRKFHIRLCLSKRN
jgi:hypothetical protein